MVKAESDFSPGGSLERRVGRTGRVAEGREEKTLGARRGLNGGEGRVILVA